MPGAQPDKWAWCLHIPHNQLPQPTSSFGGEGGSIARVRCLTNSGRPILASAAQLLKFDTEGCPRRGWRPTSPPWGCSSYLLLSDTVLHASRATGPYQLPRGFLPAVGSSRHYTQGLQSLAVPLNHCYARILHPRPAHLDQLTISDWMHQAGAIWEQRHEVLAVAHHPPERLPCRLAPRSRQVH